MSLLICFATHFHFKLTSFVLTLHFFHAINFQFCPVCFLVIAQDSAAANKCRCSRMASYQPSRLALSLRSPWRGSGDVSTVEMCRHPCVMHMSNGSSGEKLADVGFLAEELFLGAFERLPSWVDCRGRSHEINEHQLTNEHYETLNGRLLDST